MNLQTHASKAAEIPADARVELVFQDEPLPELLATDDSSLSGLLSELVGSPEMKGKAHESAVLHTQGRLSTRRLLLLGAGKRDELTLERLGKLAGQAARAAQRQEWKSLVFGGSFLVAGMDAAQVAEALVGAAVMGLMSLDTYKTEDQSKATLETMVLADPSRQAALETGGKRGLVLGEAANTARSLVNEPGNDLYPAAMAEKVKALAEGAGLSVEVLTASQMRDKGMGLLLAVGQGSDNEPRLVTIRYGDFAGKPTLGFVGKGITFDSGGISLKPGLGMQDMKTDMSGAAAVAGAMLALAQLKPQVNVLGVIPMAENMPSGKATRPGDVVRGMNGKTVEVVNTDAEGRMILADALVHAQELGATHIVDLATLTGACVVALGHVATGAMGKPQEWVDQVMSASRAVGEKIWQLPIYDEYRELIKSEIADMENAGGRWAGPITGAWFLKEFVKDETAWVHLDIAGTATIESDVPHLPKGASGVGVRALVRLAEEIAAG